MADFALSPAAAPYLHFGACISFSASSSGNDIQVFVTARGSFGMDEGIERSHSILAAEQRHGNGMERDSRELSQTGHVTKQIDIAQVSYESEVLV